MVNFLTYSRPTPHRQRPSAPTSVPPVPDLRVWYQFGRHLQTFLNVWRRCLVTCISCLTETYEACSESTQPRLMARIFPDSPCTLQTLCELPIFKEFECMKLQLAQKHFWSFSFLAWNTCENLQSLRAPGMLLETALPCSAKKIGI